MPKADRIVVHDGYFRQSATLLEIQVIWAAVSANPAITLRCLVEVTGIKKTKVHHILYFLERAGYLEHKPGYTGRRVIIPLVWI